MYDMLGVSTNRHDTHGSLVRPVILLSLRRLLERLINPSPQSAMPLPSLEVVYAARLRFRAYRIGSSRGCWVGGDDVVEGYGGMVGGPL